MDNHHSMNNMEFSEQPLKLPVENFDVGHEKTIKRHGELLPSSIRAIFCGPSNCGKTNSLMTLITHSNGLRFENLYVYSKSLYQPKYKYLENLLEDVEGVNYNPCSEHESVVPADDVLPNTVFVFDDDACEKQNNMRAYFCMGRHKNVDCFYLCQSYAQVSKHLIRDNVNLLAVFRQDEVNLRHIYDDHVTTDMSFNRFKELCRECWGNEKYGFLVIDKDRPMNDGRYRKGFDSFAINITGDK